MNTCAECIHAEMCRWMDEVERDGCDFFDGDSWIPVSERLPEDSGEYLATIYDTDENYKYMDIAELEDGIWQYKDYIKVLAWMPLPKRYEPQESEG